MRRIPMAVGGLCGMLVLLVPLFSLTFAAEQTIQVLNPRGYRPEVQLTPLSQR